jgi:hypothetical protein
MILFAILACITVFLSSGLAFGAVALGPILKADPNAGKRPFRFLISDLLWLFLLLHPGLTLLAADMRSEYPGDYLGIACMCLVVAVVLWFRGLQTLSQFGVEHWLRRGLLLVIVMPVGVSGSIAAGTTGIVLLSCLFESVTEPWQVNVSALAITCAVVVGLGTLALGCRWIARLVRRNGNENAGGKL